MEFFFSKCKRDLFLFERGVKREKEGSDGTCEGSADTTVLVQIEEAKFAIRKLPQEPAVRLLRVHPTELACLQELLKRLQDRHVECAGAVAKKAAADAASAATVSPDTPNVLPARMQLRQAKSCAGAANKLALEAEKERDADEKAVEELKRQLQPKRACTDDDAGNAHEMLAEVDNWDLRDHRQQAKRAKPSQCTSRVSQESTEAINRSLAQARTVSCITLVLVWLGGFHIGVWGTLLWRSIYLWR
jgi:hypothetical protein